jgi:hypothetical protein
MWTQQKVTVVPPEVGVGVGVLVGVLEGVLVGVDVGVLVGVPVGGLGEDGAHRGTGPGALGQLSKPQQTKLVPTLLKQVFGVLENGSQGVLDPAANEQGHKHKSSV